MSTLALTLVAKDYDHLAPLIMGDVTPEGIDLTIDRDTAKALDRTLNDPSILFGELSFARHIARLANDDRSWVGIPIFPTRIFRHRSFFTLRSSGMTTLKDLVGKKVGTNEWPATGNTWSRAVLREAGIAIDSIDWTVGFIGGASAGRPQGNLPPYVKEATGDLSLTEMLLNGDLDALMSQAPNEFYEKDSPIVRLIPDWVKAEQEYYARTKVFPAHHIFGVRQELHQREPWILRSLYLALDESKRRWQATRARLTDTTPWIQADIEASTALMGTDWAPNGIEPNLAMIKTLCTELNVQGLTGDTVEATSVFKEFNKVMAG